MKVLHLNTYEFGGAAKASIRLHEGLLGIQVHSSILFQQAAGNTAESAVFEGTRIKAHGPPSLLDRIKYRTRRWVGNSESKRREDIVIKSQIKSRTPHQIEYFSFPDSGYDITQHPYYQQADVLNLHWVADFFDYALLERINKPIVWTLHDMNPFTGGCHYSWNCRQYRENCANCEQLQTTQYPTYSAHILKLKQTALKKKNKLTIVTPSRWLRSESESSTLFRGLTHYQIPNGLDSRLYKPVDRQAARNLLGLPADKQIMLFVSDSLETRRKGFALLLEAIHTLPDKERFVLCSIGATGSVEFPAGIAVYELGYIKNVETICSAFSAADLFIIPSLMDNLPNTVLESLMCGTPVIGFPTGGIPDMIQAGKNGLLCDEVSAHSLARAINQYFEQYQGCFDRDAIRQQAIQQYDVQIQARAYLSLYERVLS